MTDHLYRGFGAAEFPPDLSASPETIFAVFDPQLDNMISFFSAAITAELSDAWNLARVGTVLEATPPVASTLWTLPTKASLRTQVVPFPVLALARTTATHEDLTIEKEQITTTWSLDYLLGPLSGADYRRLGGALNAALQILRSVIRELRHPAYENGAVQFDGFNAVTIKSSALGPASFGQDGEGLEFFGLHMDLETSETDRPLPGGFGAFDGVTHVDGVGDGEQILPNVLIARSDIPIVSG